MIETLKKPLTELVNHGGMWSVAELAKVANIGKQEAGDHLEALAIGRLVRGRTLLTKGEEGFTVYQLTKAGAEALGLSGHLKAVRGDMSQAQCWRAFVRCYAYAHATMRKATTKAAVNEWLGKKGWPALSLDDPQPWQSDLFYDGKNLLVLHHLTPGDARRQVGFRIAAWQEQAKASAGALKQIFVMELEAVADAARTVESAAYLGRGITIDPLDAVLAEGWAACGKTGYATRGGRPWPTLHDVKQLTGATPAAAWSRDQLPASAFATGARSIDPAPFAVAFYSHRLPPT